MLCTLASFTLISLLVWSKHCTSAALGTAKSTVKNEIAKSCTVGCENICIV